MITPYQLLQESGFAQHTAMVRFHYNRENTSLGAEKIAEMVRAIPGATRVSTVSLDKQHGIGIFNVKIISSKPPKEAFQLLKKNALERYQGLIVGVEVGANTIETKGEFIIKEEKKPLKPTNLGNYIGNLIEEGLLLEVSIEELRRQFVECDPPKLTAEVFEQIVQACDNKSNFATWMCKKVASDVVSTEDLQLWSEIFPFFERHKQRFQKKDINQVKTAEDVHNFIDDYNRVRDEVEAKKATGQTQKVKDETDQCLLGKLKWSDGSKWLVYKTNPGQWALERKIGSGTSWCTVASEYYFDYYMGPRYGNDAAYYIFINMANPEEKIQIHYGSSQCRDKGNVEQDYSSDRIVEFYKYLEKVDGRTQWTQKAIQGRHKNELRKNVTQELDDFPSKLSELKHQECAAATVYRLPSTANSALTALEWASFFRDMGMSKEEAVLRAESHLGVEKWMTTPVCLIKFKDNKGWDIVSDSYQDKLCSYKNGADVTLPQATVENYEAYTVAAKYCNTDIMDRVRVACDPSLEDISVFEVKSEGDKKLYKFSPEDRTRALKAIYQTGVSNYYVSQIMESVHDIFAYKDNNTGTYGVFTDSGRWFQKPDEVSKGSIEDTDARIEIFNFAGILDRVCRANTDSTDASVIKWKKVGQTRGFLEDLRSSIDEQQPDGISNDYCVGRSTAIATLLIHDEVGSVPFLCKRVGNEVPESIIVCLSGRVCLFKPKQVLTGYNSLNTQGDLVGTGVPLMFLVKFCQYVPCEIPRALEKLYARSRGIYGSTPNVTKVLRDQKDHFRDFEIPYVWSYRRNVIYREIGTGVYGTWAQLGPAIRESDPQNYSRISNAIQAHPDCSADVFLHYNRDRASRSWNGIIRLINREGKVVWYARRYGNNRSEDWSIREVEPNFQADAGEAQSNYQAPTPVAPRAPRQPRQAAQQAVPAQPAPERTAETQQALNRSKVNTNNSDEAYVFNENNYAESLRSLGFTNLVDTIPETETVNKVLVYKCFNHKGSMTHVAVLNLQGRNTIVAGYPVNPTFAVAQSHSSVWRQLTRELDNSVRTFQQCVDICTEQRFTLPVALQGWLVYRGAHQ